MSKPICVVYYIEPVYPEKATAANVQIALDERFPDYHVLVCPVHSSVQERHIEIEVFYDKDFKEIQYEEMKEWIESWIQPLGTPTT